MPIGAAPNPGSGAMETGGDAASPTTTGSRDVPPDICSEVPSGRGFFPSDDQRVC